MRVPYLAKFYLYARRYSSEEVCVRALCLTEPDRAEHPLELQEEFGELCRSEFVEIYDKSEVREISRVFRLSIREIIKTNLIFFGPKINDV